ncbi:FKBP-type peptidyl-prolyl cis-trans isomerase domain [Dillenia turbinata]|uniref:peptidylprolyl isomerase n=1 Tax=Dillenia turbinata TaxID=194707 RepID=A0AAN8ZAH4_9MAGN
MKASIFVSANGSLSPTKPLILNPLLPGGYSSIFDTTQRRRAPIIANPQSLDHIHDPLPQKPNVVSGGGLVRRQALITSLGFVAGTLFNASKDPAALASEFADMPALRGKNYGKTKMRYPDYTETDSGLQYKDLRVGSGPLPKMGETVLVDWDGYTIGYYGRIFEARNKTKGGSFEGNDKDFFKFKIGSQQVIPAFEEAVSGMAPGGIRRIIVPPELGYPDNDFNRMGPRPTTFSGQRALDFVLRNQGLIDKTLLFDIELLKIVPN